MRSISAVILALALFAVPATAKKPPKPPKPPAGSKVNVSAAPNPVTFGRSVLLTAKDASAKGVPTSVLGSAAPFSGGFGQVASGTSDANGSYSVRLTPKVNTKYRVTFAPADTSGDLLVLVAFRPTLTVGDSTPARGARVRFSGSVAPARNGRTLLIQRRQANGSYGSVAKTTLRTGGPTRSVYSTRVRVSTSGTFRAYIKGDVSNSTGTSATRRLRVH